MPADDSTTRLTKAVAATVTTLLVALLVAPVFVDWNSSRLAIRLAKQIELAEDAEVKVPLRQLAALGDHSIEPLVQAATSERASVAIIARQILEEKLATWQKLSEPHLAESTDDFSTTAAKLAAALSSHIEDFGPEGKLWAERIALAMIELSDRFSAPHVGPLLTDCDHVLAAVPPRGPRLQTITSRTQAIDSRPAVRFETVQPKLESLTRASESSLENLARTRPSEPLEFRGRLTKVQPPSSTLAAKPTPRDPNWSPSWNGSRSTDSQPIPKSQPSARLDTTETSAPAPLKSQVLDVPTPRDMQNQANALRRLPSETLLLRLQSANFYQAGIIRVVLGERGFEEAELALLQQAESPEVSDRLQLIEEVSVVPAATAQRLLRLLLKDENADVRLRALTALATTNAPDIAALARDLAVRDEDSRVAELASRLLRQVR